MTESQNRLMTEILQLGLLKVRNIIDRGWICRSAKSMNLLSAIQARMVERKLTRITVYEKMEDNVLGILSLRDLILHSQQNVRTILA